MIDTPDLIDDLAKDMRPVRRLRSPLARAGLWLLLAAILMTLIAIEHGLRPDIAEQLRQPTYLTGLLASAATGILAAVGCLMASVPDRSRLWLLLPLPPLAVWISTTGNRSRISDVGLNVLRHRHRQYRIGTRDRPSHIADNH